MFELKKRGKKRKVSTETTRMGFKVKIEYKFHTYL